MALKQIRQRSDATSNVPTAEVTGSLDHLVGDGERSPYPLMTDTNERSSICIAATVSSSHLRSTFQRGPCVVSKIADNG
jgi:hypothetical protein